jgi:hypothetical protein
MGLVDTQQQSILNPNVLRRERTYTVSKTSTSPLFNTTELLKSWDVLNSVSWNSLSVVLIVVITIRVVIDVLINSTSKR